ncbi:MAG: DNA/RNA nuclease SfsA [Thermoplasmata archaeon]|nr:MAG: DNA/RNA nuclease SfsA [Thermoplasmata archaeon]
MSIPVMEIPWDAKGIFRSRPNRFLGIADITSSKKEKKRKVKVHVHDPGRLKELLYPKNQVLLRKATTKNRKTKWDLIAANHNKEWILVRSGFHRQIAEWIIKNPEVSPFGGIKSFKPEAKFGKSRLDFLLTKNSGKKIWVEVKGCTLAKEGVALFPDAPTERGRRHLQHLIKAKEKGDEAVIMILVFRPDAESFAPNKETDPKFSDIFFKAVDVGVWVYPFLFRYEDEMILYNGKIPLHD